jgi:hypothetical protein
MTVATEWTRWMKADGTPRNAFWQDELSTCEISRGQRAANVTPGVPDFKGELPIAFGQIVALADSVDGLVVVPVSVIIQQAAPPQFRDHVKAIAPGPACGEQTPAVTVPQYQRSPAV